MNKRIKKLWIKALRSGKYKQAHGRLRRGRGAGTAYCCLGVLCEVAKADGVIRSYCGQDGFPPDKVLAWAAIEANPRIGKSPATRLNDRFRRPFSVIADRIEKYL